MNPDLFNMFAPQGDPFALGSLFGMAGQDPEKAIPLLAQMGVEPPSKDMLFRPQENFFADSNGNQAPWQGTGGDRPNVPTGRDMRNLSRAPTDGNLSSYEDTFGTHWLPQGSPAETRKEAAPYLANQPEGQVPLPRPRPNNLQEQDEPDRRGAIDENDSYLTANRAEGMQFSSSNRPPEDPLAALKNPQNKAIFDAEIKNQNPLQQLNMTPPGAPPAPNPMAAVAPKPQAGPLDTSVWGDPTGGGPGQYSTPQAPTLPQGAGVPLPKSRDLAVLSKLEGGNYGQMVDAGNGDFAYGAFGIMGKNIPQWTKDVLGVSMTPQEFLSSPEAQDRVAQAKFGDMRARHGSGEAATREWHAGPGGMNNPNRRDVFGTTPFTHADNYTRYAANLGQSKGAQGINPNGGVEVSSRARPVEQPVADSPQAQAKTKKAATLADMLKGVAAPTVPSAIMPSGHAPLPPAGKGVEMNGAISQALAALAMGKKDPVSMLRLQQALGGR